MKGMKWINVTALALAGVGAVNWGLQTFANYNVVTSLTNMLPESALIAKIIYGVVAVSGIYTIYYGVKENLL